MQKLAILIYSVLAFLLISFTSFAQTTQTFSADDYTYRTALELFDREKYATAQKAFQDYIDLNKGDLLTVEAKYYVAICALYLENDDAEPTIERFIAEYPNHPKAALAYYEMGNYYFNQKNTDKAIAYFEKVDISSLSKEQQVEAKFKLAYLYFSKQDFLKAGNLFDELKRSNNKYTYAASYYAGYCNYRKGSYTEALTDLKRAAQSPEYAPMVPYMIVNVYYKQGKYDELIEYAQTLGTSKDIRNADEVFLLVGESYYRKGDYANAARYLKESVGKTKSRPAPEIAYRLGYAQYKTGDFKSAAENFKITATTAKDTLAQYASYHMGLSYLQSGNKPFALTAFDQARRGKASKQVAEDAAYYHAKVSFETNAGPETTALLKDFLKNYPTSSYKNEINELLSESYLASNNYNEAIAHIEAIPNRTPKIDEAYQRVTFNKGAEFFNKDQYNEALTQFQKSLSRPKVTEVAIAAHFWSGETQSAVQNYPSAINEYAAVFREPESKNTEYYNRSRYGIGYAYYNNKEYDKAATHFREYTTAVGPNGKNYADALVRLADCQYVAKNFDAAIQLYDQALALPGAEKDYILFQKANALNFAGRDEEARRTFDELSNKYSSSRYADNAMYQRADVDFEKGNYNAAITGFTRVIESNAASGVVPYALQKRALAYSNLQQYDKAIADYQRILDKYPTSKVSNSALLGLQETLASAKRSDEFGTYLEKYRRANPQDNSTESIEFDAAKSLYLNEKYPQAISAMEAYIRNHPDSEQKYDARYYIADSYYKFGDRANAVKNFQLVINEGRSQYLVRSVSRMGDLELNAKNYSSAAGYYRRLLTASQSKKDQTAALSGLMESYYQLPNYDSARYYISQVVATGGSSPSAVNKALLYKGKSYYLQNNYEKAVDELLSAANAAQDEYGAEAQYLVADALYKQKKYKESLEMCFAVNDKFGSFEKWRGKAFLLVADNYVALDETFQAKATLQSIIENSGDKEVVAEAKNKLKALESK
ncbi:tetratricopeptide repeat protein [Cytophagaceae bacterium DM2B3-1]|uniref:Tetratricopeptide repeat protein n=1 Tax=Xanthocytophaga flava TaxID=3048013 RepID=A0ABT7CT97_9BACT|nr:tetratricopeptide repeat protein [Xanthocytophaga flavus]MDJ1496998.1 tetratricopeptide repeat protein [Xanthocytophaga flavus]